MHILLDKILFKLMLLEMHILLGKTLFNLYKKYQISTIHVRENHCKVKNYSIDFSFWSILLSASKKTFLQREIDI